jgi:peptide-methionine (S)-S-oxide reductase
METATLAGGCFWCLEAIFNRMEGVMSVQSGYMGGKVAHPTYEQVCTGMTGHAEVVQLTFDPAVVSFAEILDVFFATHDPTSLNRQGNDVGAQYRSAIFFHSDAQRRAAEEALRSIPNAVTELRPAAEFYQAEAYHDRYFESHPAQPYCAYVVAPKVKKFLSKFPERVKA